MNKTETLKLALEALEYQLMQAGGETGCDHEIGICFCLETKAITAIKEALAQPEQEPECVAVINVLGNDWRIEHLSLPVGKHRLYAQQYTYTAPPKLEQEPVGHIYTIAGVQHCTIEQVLSDGPLYTTPPKREWVGLTEKASELVYEDVSGQSLRPQDYRLVLQFAVAVEAKLKELNHD
jgi:hypothetical protein